MTDTATRTLTVTVPEAPPSGLMPNQASKQAGWYKRSELRREAREVAKYAALGARPSDWRTITGPVRLDIFVGWPKGRRPDLDAAVSSCKAHQDGLADAGIIADDKQIIEIRATHEYGHPKPGFLQLTVIELEPEP